MNFTLSRKPVCERGNKIQLGNVYPMTSTPGDGILRKINAKKFVDIIRCFDFYV